MHSSAVRIQAHRLHAAGLRDGEVAVRLGLPRTTVRDWRRSTGRPEPALCPRCWRSMRPVSTSSGDYAELLAMYLGDGCISPAGRVQRLRLSLDARYPAVVHDAEALLRRCFPQNEIGRVWADAGATVVLSVYHAHLACLLPQHGPGKKHERRIELERWQEEHVRRAPWAFVRGCIRTDGCVFVNRTGPYTYLAYDFFNLSDDIREIFMRACDYVGVEYRRHASRVRINRCSSVALMRARVGVKC